HAERTNEGGVFGDELCGGIKRYLAIVPGQSHLQEASITVAQVLNAFGPGRRLAHTTIDDVGPESAWGLGQHRPYALFRRAQLVDIEGDIRAERLGQLQAFPWSTHHNGAGGASQACQAEGKQPNGAPPLHHYCAPEPGLRAAHGMRRHTEWLVQRGNGRTRVDLEHK